MEERRIGPPACIRQVDEVTWELPTRYKEGMRVPGRIIATKELLQAMDTGVFDQTANVASLPGIVNYSFCMPDGHWGYGFPIGGVAAFDKKEGIISPGGVGFDINCGMRSIMTPLTYDEIKGKMKELINTLFQLVPAGVGRKGFVDVGRDGMHEIMVQGAKKVIDDGFGRKEDLKRIEAHGCIPWADPDAVYTKAIARGINQIGTLGSGNHYLEIQVAKKENIHDQKIAKAFGFTKDNQVEVMVHCGSRGFGHQIASDYLKVFETAMKKYDLSVPDPELSCAPFESEEGQQYFKAMACAANMAFANRQVITHRIREAFEKVFGQTEGIDLLYDVSHNIAKLEKFKVDGKIQELVVHRKGATRAYPPNHPELDPLFKKTGQPVILGGSMETGSYLLVGTEEAMQHSFGSTAHGAGRTMSRAQAKREVRGDELQKNMEKKGILVKAVSMSGLAEEAGCAYKNIDLVVDALARSGISQPVVKLLPVGNIKG